MDMALVSCSGRNLTYSEVIELMRRNEIIVIDVRDRGEIRATGSIPGSINIPLKEVREALSDMDCVEFRRRYGSRLPDKMAILLFFCQSGVRSLRAMEVALRLGFEKGFPTWLMQLDLGPITSNELTKPTSISTADVRKILRKRVLAPAITLVVMKTG